MNAVNSKKNVRTLWTLKKAKKKIVALTAADFMTARILDEAGVDVILVGDSLGNTVLGYESTIFVNLREMLHHLKAVVRAKPRAMVVVDLPFGSYHQSKSQAVRNAIRMIREGGADAVKLEGGAEQEETIQAIVRAGIPVMAHLGLLPQSVLRQGGYLVRGKTRKDAATLKKDLRAVERAGAFACVFEYIEARTSKQLTRQSRIPTIGIGSGVHCDGQVLVTADMLGLESWLSPRAARRYADLGRVMKKAFIDFGDDVRKGRFPGMSESF